MPGAGPGLPARATNGGSAVSSPFGLTVDEGLARVMEAQRIAPEPTRRAEIRKILEKVRLLAFHEGYDASLSDSEEWEGS